MAGAAHAEAKLTNDDYSDTPQCGNSGPEYLLFDQLAAYRYAVLIAIDWLFGDY
jgi:hypothetical protein